MLDGLIERQLRRHGSADKSLAAVPVSSALKEQIKSLGQPDLEASLARLSTAADDPYATVAPDGSESPNLRYRILRPHARGGLGEVFVAEDTELHREVALKEIQPQHAGNDASRGRFVLEAEITGGLEHPGIVPVYGLGTYRDGRPFYAMRFIKGDNLKEAIARYYATSTPRGESSSPAGRDADNLEFRQLLGRFIDVCNAVAYAHSRGVLHRDLKPGNIMLGKFGETLVVDWGLAKVVGRVESHKRPGDSPSDEVTLRLSSGSGVAASVAGSAVGTPAYMSPEQAAGKLNDLGPTTDVYSLGATLYTLLTNRPPVEGADVAEVLRKVQRGDIDWAALQRSPHALVATCKKAMALQPADRYATPLALAEDLEHWLADEPVSAHREPILVRTRRWMRQHRTLVTSAAAVLLVATLGSIVASALLARVNRQLDDRNQALDTLNGQLDDRNQALDTANGQLNDRNQALDQANQKLTKRDNELSKANKNLAELARKEISSNYDHSVALAYREWFSGNLLKWGTLLNGCPPRLRGWDWDFLKSRGQAELCSFRPNTALWSVAFSRDGRWLAYAGEDKQITIRNAATLELLHLLPGPKQTGHRKEIRAVAFSRDGRWLASASADGTVKIWDVVQGTVLRSFDKHQSEVNHVAFSPDRDSTTIASIGADGWVKVWDRTSGDVRHSLPCAGGSLFSAVAFAPDGSLLACQSDKGYGLAVWDTASGQKAFDFQGHLNRIMTVDFSADGRYIASGGMDGTVKVWDLRIARRLGKDNEDILSSACLVNNFSHDNYVSCLAFSRESSHLASASWDQTLKLWDLATAPRSIAFADTPALSSDWPSAPTANTWLPPNTTAPSSCGKPPNPRTVRSRWATIPRLCSPGLLLTQAANGSSRPATAASRSGTPTPTASSPHLSTRGTGAV